MRISLLQIDIAWENKKENLRQLQDRLEELSGQTDMAVLPEMFSTGFTMHSKELAEPVDGETITTLQAWAKKYQIALVGSHIASEGGKYFNRAFFLTPEGESYFYNKRHLFRMGHEEKYFSAGNHRLIVPFRGWNICLLVCYDLRFPVWSRNIHNEYDLLIYVANWPASRRLVWNTLLPARAIENMSYVCGVNRVGTDGNGLVYNGGSTLYSPRGKALAQAEDNKTNAVTIPIGLDELNTFRKKFPVWLDADEFNMPYSI